MEKQTVVSIVILLSMMLLLSNCRRQNTPSIIVDEVINGNTVRLSSGKELSLIGVSDTDASEQFLKELILNETVSYRFDSKYNSFSDKVYVYMKRKRDALDINGQMISDRTGELALDYLHDSLATYKAYFSGETAVHLPKENLPSGSSTPISIKRPRKGQKLTEVIKMNEQSVFLVINRDARGNVQGTGTGFFIQEHGIAVSNYHVFEGGSSWEVKLLDGELLRVSEILLENPDDDFIIFKVGEGEVRVAPLFLGEGNIDKGEEVIVIGNPKGLESTLTKGHVSSSNRDYNGTALIQIDAAISPGSSGSPVMTVDGIVIGVATLKFNDCESCNFAVNIKEIKSDLDRIKIPYYE